MKPEIKLGLASLAAVIFSSIGAVFAGLSDSPDGWEVLSGLVVLFMLVVAAAAAENGKTVRFPTLALVVILIILSIHGHSLMFLIPVLAIALFVDKEAIRENRHCWQTLFIFTLALFSFAPAIGYVSAHNSQNLKKDAELTQVLLFEKGPLDERYLVLPPEREDYALYLNQTLWVIDGCNVIKWAKMAVRYTAGDKVWYRLDLTSNTAAVGLFFDHPIQDYERPP